MTDQMIRRARIQLELRGKMLSVLRGAHWIFLTTLAAILVWVSGAQAQQIELTLKGGGGFKVVGDLKSYDGRRYTIVNPSFGKMVVDGRRFDCVSNCPTGPTRASVSASSILRPGQNSKITISGSNTVGNQLMPDLIKAFATRLQLKVVQVPQANPLDLVFVVTDRGGGEVARIDLFRRGSSTSFRALQSGRAAIGMSSRPIKPVEVATLNAAGLGNMRAASHEHVLALDGLLIVAAPNNPAVSISIEDVARVFSGQISDWSQLGYAPGRINVHAPDVNSGTWDTFKSLVLAPRNLKLVAKAKRTPNHSQQSDWVAADPLAIGVVGIAYRRSAKVLNIESTCGLITPPSGFSIKTEEYPLTRRLYLYTPGRPRDPLAAGLLDFSLSAEAQATIRDAAFVDQSVELISFNDQESRIAFALNAPPADFDLPLMRTLLTDIRGASRLTYTFRFNSGSFALESKSLADAKRLVKAMQSSKLANRVVKLIGFADSAGSFQDNLALSLSRANAVRDALVAAGGSSIDPSRIVVKGYGELAPVACNDSLPGKVLNRRVEAWVGREQQEVPSATATANRKQALMCLKAEKEFAFEAPLTFDQSSGILLYAFNVRSCRLPKMQNSIDDSRITLLCLFELPTIVRERAGLPKINHPSTQTGRSSRQTANVSCTLKNNHLSGEPRKDFHGLLDRLKCIAFVCFHRDIVWQNDAVVRFGKKFRHCVGLESIAISNF